MLLVLFGLAVGFLVYVYVGFPALAAVAAAWRGRPVRRAPITPKVSLVIAAYNEEAAIADRLENALAVDYPGDRLEIIVASDGSTDGTEAIARRFAGRGVRLLALPRRGKLAALNQAVAHAQGEILVFSDANTSMDPGALRAIVRNFADPDVGGVAGNTHHGAAAAGETSGRGEALYWRYDRWLKERESRAGSVVSAHGGLYAIRRGLYQPPEETAGTDDFLLSTAVVAQGFRLVFEREARAWELVAGDARRDFRRRVRLMTRGWRAVMARRSLFDPRRHGFYAVALFSHKVLRRLAPAALVLLVTTSIALVPRGGVFPAFATAQVGFGLLAAVGYATRRSRTGRRKPLYIPYFFCMANAAALVALANYLRGRRIELWRPARDAAGAEGTAP